jgi:hypothetical protein
MVKHELRDKIVEAVQTTDEVYIKDGFNGSKINENGDFIIIPLNVMTKK